MQKAVPKRKLPAAAAAVKNNNKNNNNKRKNNIKKPPVEEEEKEEEEHVEKDTFFTDDDDDDESENGSASSKKSSDDESEKDAFFDSDSDSDSDVASAFRVARPQGAFVADEQYRGGILGLLTLGVNDIDAIDDIDAATQRALRLSQNSFVHAALEASHSDSLRLSRPSRLPPVLRIACFDASNKVYIDPRELASAAIDAAAASASPATCPASSSAVVESLPDHLLRLRDAKRKFARNVPDTAIRRQLWDMDGRFATYEGEEEPVQWIPEDSVGAEAISACALDGSIALTGGSAVSTAVIKRLLGPSRVYSGDAVRIRAGREVLIDRVAWLRALRKARLPAFITSSPSKKFEIGSKVAAAAVLSTPSVAETAKALHGGTAPPNVRAAMMACGIADGLPEGTDMFEVVRDVQARTLALDDEKASDEDMDLDDAAVAAEAAVQAAEPPVIAELERFVGSSVTRGGAPALAPAPRPKKTPPESPDAGCDLVPLPGDADRFLGDWLRKRPEANDPTASASEAGAAQGHMSTAGPVLVLVDAAQAEPSIRVYDHVRSVDPGSACLSASAAKLRAAGEAVRAQVDASFAIAKAARGSRTFSDVASELRAFAIAYESIRRPPQEPLGSSATADAARIASEVASLAAQDEIDYDSLLALGITDASHYSSSEAPRPLLSSAKERPEDFLAIRGARVFSARDMLAELSTSLGLNPALGVAEERAVLDGLEYHMPSGEGEQARILRNRIAEIRRRRVELMAKSDSSGRRYDAVERKVMDRLRAEAAPKMLAETVVNLCAVLSAVVLSPAPERVQNASPALSACVASLRRKDNDNGSDRDGKGRGRGKGGRGRGKRAAGRFVSGGADVLLDVDVLDLLACAAAGLLASRLPAPTPTQGDLRPEIEAAEAVVVAELPSVADDGLEDMMRVSRGGLVWPIDFRPLRSQRKSRETRSRPSGKRVSASSRLMSALWDHVRAEHGARIRVQDQVVGIRSASACCAFAVAEPEKEEKEEADGGEGEGEGEGEGSVVLPTTRWGALASVSEELRRAFDEERRTAEEADRTECDAVLAGVPAAATTESTESVYAFSEPVEKGPATSSSSSFSQADAVVFEARALPERPPVQAEDDDDDVADYSDQLASLLDSDPILGAELVPPTSATAASLRTQTTSRYAALVKALNVDDAVASDLWHLLVEQEASGDGDGDGHSGERISAGFLRSELGPSLYRLATSANLTAALAADHDLSQVAAMIATAAASSTAAGAVEAAVALRARFKVLSLACAAACDRAPRIASEVAIWAMWALSRAGEPVDATEPKLAEACARAATVVFSRLVERSSFNRRDRGADELVALQQKMEDARALARSAVENLSDEQREVLRERRRIGHVEDPEDAVGAAAGAESDAAASDAASDASDAPGGIVDAMDMYATD